MKLLSRLKTALSKLLTPTPTKNEKWAIDNGVLSEYNQGYESEAGDDNPHSDTLKRHAWNLGKVDSVENVLRQR